MEATDHAVLASLERDLLRREVVERAIEFAIDELRPGSDPAELRRDEILREMRRLDGELSRLTAAVASGGLPALLAAVKERQAQRECCERALIELDATARIGRHEIPPWSARSATARSEEHTSELQSHSDLVCRLLLEKN